MAVKNTPEDLATFFRFPKDPLEFERLDEIRAAGCPGKRPDEPGKPANAAGSRKKA